MSSPTHSSLSTGVTSAAPATPPKTPTKTVSTAPSVRVTLPTPPSFSARKAAQRAAESPLRAAPVEDATGEASNTISTPPRPSSGDNKKQQKGHNRSVSFNLPDLSPITPSDSAHGGDSPTTASAGPNSAPLGTSTSTGKYKIPQRSGAALTSVSGGVIAPAPAPYSATLPNGKRGPPRPLNLGPSLVTVPGPRIKTAGAVLGGGGGGGSGKVSSGFFTPSTTPSRWGSTAAARGLSLNPSALNSPGEAGTAAEAKVNKRHSTSMAGSIWSAALPSLGEASGWISPALASARSVMGNNRTRGLTVAVLKEEGSKELLLETLPTPGLPKLPAGGEVEHKEKTEEEEGKVGVQAVGDKDVPGTPLTGSFIKPREIILCRYYHTPGLTCTSRPCRFIHSLDKLDLASPSISSSGETFEMRTPRTALFSARSVAPASAKSDLSTTSTGSNGNRADFTGGTFAAHQLQSRMKSLTVKDVDEKGIEPGERVTVSSQGGEEVPGVVFLMSGGGKGAVGKSKIKYKTEQCRDFAAGHCPYGDYCSFLHGENSRTPEPAKTTGVLPSPSKIPSDEPTEAELKAARRKSFDPSAIRKPLTNAWKSGPPTALRPAPLKLDRSNIANADAVHSKTASAGNANEQGLSNKDATQDVTKLGKDGAQLSAVPKFSAFAVPYTQKPVEVDTQGNIVPASARLAAAALKSGTGLNGTFAAAQKSAVPPFSSVKENVNPASPGLIAGRSHLAGAWRKGAPTSISTVRIIEPTNSQIHPSLHSASAGSANGSDGASSGNEPDAELLTPLGPPGAQTLTIPRQLPWGGLGSATDSDPATPWDPALRAARDREVEEQDAGKEQALSNQQGVVYGHHGGYAEVPYTYGGFDPSTNAPWSAGPDFGQGQGQYSSEGQYGANEFPYGAPTYPWGMPMSPVNMNAQGGQQDNAPGAQQAQQPEGGLGVMWTPAGWAVQDAAMKMALFTAEAKAAGREMPGVQAKNYYRTKKCRFFAQGICPHGDACTFIHSTSNTSPRTDSQPPKPHAKSKTQPCKFFNSAIGCQNGDACTFMHTRVVPDSVPIVEKPRPWRTRPCRHFQVGRCHLGDACHFAHVYEAPQKDGYKGEYLTEERLERAMMEMQAMQVRNGGEDSDDDDIEIVTTGDNSMSFSLSRSQSGSTIVSRQW